MALHTLASTAFEPKIPKINKNGTNKHKNIACAAFFSTPLGPLIDLSSSLVAAA